MTSADLELLARYVKLRDAEAFAELAARHRDMVYATCYRLLGGRTDAEDAAQECFLQLARRGAAVSSSVGGWLHRVAVRTSLAARHRDQARRRAEREAGSITPDRTAGPTWEDIKAEVDQAIDRLPDDLRVPLVLHFLQGKTQTATAEELGISQPTVSARLMRAVERLRRHLGPAGSALSVAGLVALLGARSAEAAPATLIANLGRLALTGVAPSLATGLAASVVGRAASMTAATKTVCLLAVCVVVGLVVRQTVQQPSATARAPRATSAVATAQPPRTSAVPGLPTPPPDEGRPRQAPAASGGKAGPVGAPAPRPALASGRGPEVPTAPTRVGGRKPPRVGPSKPRPGSGPTSPARGAAASGPPLAASPAEKGDPPIRIAQGAPAAPPVTPPVVDQGGQTIGGAEGVRIARVEPGVDAEFVTSVAQVVAAAKQAMEATFPDRHLDQISLVFARARTEAHESVVTNRRDTIYIRSDPSGIGELLRPDAGPVAILCDAVADLYNPRQLPGLNRFVAHRYLVPAVAGEVPPEFLEDHRNIVPLAPDGPEMLTAVSDPLYSRVYPDFAAAAALSAIQERLKLEGLRALLGGIPGNAEDPFGALRQAAVKEAPELAKAFAAYDEALRLEVDDKGSCLIASFEPNEAIREAPPLRKVTDTLLLMLSPQNKWSLSDEWSTDGTHSLKVEADETAPWMSVVIDDADWKFKDWRRFSEFSLDFRIVAPAAQYITICAQDHPTCGHGGLLFFQGAVEPGEPRHVSFPLSEQTLLGARDVDATYFSGAFRADSVSRVYIGFGKPKQPITLYLDNLRLKVRR